jgi:hypothetical protein
MSALPKLVFSRTLTGPLAWKNTRLLNGPVADEIRVLNGFVNLIWPLLIV